MKRKLIFLSIIALSLTMLLVTACNSNKKVSKDTFMLDTIVNITLYNYSDDSVIDDAFKKVRELENVLSVHRQGSDLYRIRVSAGINPIKVSAEALYLIKSSIDYYNMTDKLYDISLGPLIELWNKYREKQIPPNEKEIENILPYVGSDRIVVDEDNSAVMLDKGMFLDFGACAKGYIADVIKQYLLDSGVEHAIISLGGNINIIGSKPDGGDFNIGIRNPNEDAGSYMGILDVSDISVVTSGDYERYYEVNGKRYHHILDPSTGYPAENDLKSVSIISKNSMQADILSTSVYLLGLEEGKKLVEGMDDAEAIFVTENNEVYVTSGLTDKFRLVDDSFKYMD